MNSLQLFLNRKSIILTDPLQYLSLSFRFDKSDMCHVLASHAEKKKGKFSELKSTRFTTLMNI